ncbi:MAG: hypothetical protein WBM40_07855 [Thiohalocapsa sp.]
MRRGVGIAVGFLVFSGVGIAQACERPADRSTDRLSRAELIDRVVRYHPHPDSKARARIARTLGESGQTPIAAPGCVSCTSATTLSARATLD